VRSSVLGNWVNEKTERATLCVAGARKRGRAATAEAIPVLFPPRTLFSESPSSDIYLALSCSNLNSYIRRAESFISFAQRRARNLNGNTKMSVVYANVRRNRAREKN